MRCPVARWPLTTMAVAPSPTHGEAGCVSGNVARHQVRLGERARVLARPDSIRPAAIVSCATGLAQAASTVSAQAPGWRRWRGHATRVGRHQAIRHDRPREDDVDLGGVDRRPRAPRAQRAPRHRELAVGSAILRSTAAQKRIVASISRYLSTMRRDPRRASARRPRASGRPAASARRAELLRPVRVSRTRSGNHWPIPAMRAFMVQPGDRFAHRHVLQRLVATAARDAHVAVDADVEHDGDPGARRRCSART